ADTLVDGERRRDIAITQQQGDGVAVDLTTPPWMRFQCLQFGTEEQHVPHQAVIERALSEAVAAEVETALTAIPKREGKHSHAARQCLLEAPLLNCGQQHLSVRMTAENN